MSSEQHPVIIYEQVRKNQIKTFVLIAFYIIIIFTICFSLGYYYENVTLGIGVAIFIVFILLPIQMLTGNKMIGSRTDWAEADLSNPGEKRVYNLVEGLSIAAGLKDMPKVYILPTDTPNAFAGGLSLKNTYIGVTSGLIDLLDEAEMEGVLAHEISHIVQRDVLVSTVSIYLMSAAIILGSILYRISRYNLYSGNRRSNSKNEDNSAASFAVIALAGLVLSIVIRFVANLINLAISRKREYIADANAVRLCGYSGGIANALEKISNFTPEYSKKQVADLGGDEMLCLYIFNPSRFIIPLFSTHPPIEERIKLLRNMY